MPHANPTTTVAEAGTVQDAAKRAAEAVVRKDCKIFCPNDAPESFPAFAGAVEETASIIAAEFAPLADELSRLKGLLAKIEWNGMSDQDVCPACRWGRKASEGFPAGHSPDCELRAALAAAALSPSAGEGDRNG